MDWRDLALAERETLRGAALKRRNVRVLRVHGARLGLDAEGVARLLAEIRLLERGERAPAEPVAVPKFEVEERDDRLRVDTRAQDLIRNLDDLVRAAGVDLAKWRPVSHKVNTWPVAQKGPDGRPQVTRLWQVTANFEPRFDGQVRPVAERPAMPRVTPEFRPVRCAVVVPDSQHGFWRDAKSGKLRPLHDRRAVDAVIQLIQLLSPDELVLLGDMLDLAAWSVKYPRPVGHLDVTQPALEELHVDIRRMRHAAPEARMRYLEGNHENRVNRALVDLLGEAATVSAVGDDGGALSIPRLLALDTLDVEYVGPYGADLYLWDRVRLTHGDRVRNKGGASAQAVISDAVTSTGFGHVHRLERASKTVRTPSGPDTITAWTPGCLCRIDGAVPGVSAHPDWQQGVAVIWFDGEREHTQLVEIHDGRLVWGGVVIQGEDRGAWYAEQTGWPVG
jgi:hypothetical protein